MFCRLGISSLVENILVADPIAITLEFGWYTACAIRVRSRVQNLGSLACPESRLVSNCTIGAVRWRVQNRDSLACPESLLIGMCYQVVIDTHAD